MIITPLRPYLKTRQIGIIPHNVFHYLPFAALTDGQRYFGDDHLLFYLPSASVLPFIKEKRKPIPKSLLALSQGQAEGLPLLQYADRTAEDVARLYNTMALTNSAATETAFRARTNSSDIIFIAAHGKLNTLNPLFSQIVLAPDKSNDGVLEVHEVYGLDLKSVSLVVLSACQTQLGEHSQGDDIIGLNRAFIYAGTPTVVASLWSVQDKQTGELMVSFFKHLKEGMSKAEALQAAQREMRANYPHPYYWAAFVLTGEP
jgi:CHAT domain-containing protein